MTTAVDARIGWSRRTPSFTLGISEPTPSWSPAPRKRIGLHALLAVNLDLEQTKNLMLHLNVLDIQRQQVFSAQWNRHITIEKTISMWQDGGRGYNIIMTTSLSSDVPVGYFSWAEYDIMAPMHLKTEDALAAAFISNCGARNFRLQALERLEKLDIKIDSYGSCHRNRDGEVDKIKALKHYKFSLAFENSNEEDYVTEKFFQSLVAGAVPVVVGAPNIQDFAPSSGSVLHIKKLDDVASVAKTIKYLASHPDAYNKSVSWKYDGPSDSFKALMDMAAVHSSCRLCIHLATKIREKEEMTTKFQTRPCKCISSKGTVYHVYVRERGRFEMESLYLRSGSLTLKALESAVLTKFKSLNHSPIWKNERPEVIRGDDNLKIYKIYPVGLAQRQALYSFNFDSDADLRKHVESHPCAKFEVIFV
ncbi:glycoprotein 3-alpha-L-fucosyltransferase A-like isoform X2 [Phoenix dactylifera]|uniref:Fucosyltransferase n=1 Tax=Phoenix dactylifera TaxID=42345 RepID=A0A8B7CSE5_PHODC|nr:glycoprotein 3-alpha-L-fucosyltransferase A-like isoform X2 [Phoenix dactylifera]